MVLGLFSCTGPGSALPTGDEALPPVTPRTPLFQPPPGQKLLFLGQDNGTIAGYLADPGLVKPAGYASYTSVANAGVWSAAEYGAGPVFAEALLDRPEVSGARLALGYSLVGESAAVGRGAWDTPVKTLARWVKQRGSPVFLRIGYEFNNPANRYTPLEYRRAFRRIVWLFETEGAANCAFVWQSDGQDSAADRQAYYPGDAYVDWCGVSYFEGTNGGMAAFAAAHHKPVMVAEATPVGFDLATDSLAAWERWFVPFLDWVEATPVVQAMVYIDTDWPSQPMWISGFFQNTDARLEAADPATKAAWNQRLSRGWITGGPAPGTPGE